MIEIFTLKSDLSLTRKIAYPEKTGVFWIKHKIQKLFKAKNHYSM